MSEIYAEGLSVGDYVEDNYSDWARVDKIEHVDSDTVRGECLYRITWTLSDGKVESETYCGTDAFTLLDLGVIELDEWDRVYVALMIDDPEPGDVIRYGRLRPVMGSVVGDRYAEESGYGYPVDEKWTRYVEIPSTGHSSLDDGHGDFVGLSNYERLREDFGEHVIDACGGGYGSAALYVKVGQVVPAELIRVIAGLRDYPIYDEEDHSRREIEGLWEWAEQVVGIVAWHLDVDGIPDMEDALTPVMQQYMDDRQIYRAEDLSESDFEEYVRAALS